MSQSRGVVVRFSDLGMHSAGARAGLRALRDRRLGAGRATRPSPRSSRAVAARCCRRRVPGHGLRSRCIASFLTHDFGARLRRGAFQPRDALVLHRRGLLQRPGRLAALLGDDARALLRRWLSLLHGRAPARLMPYVVVVLMEHRRLLPHRRSTSSPRLSRARPSCRRTARG